MSAKKNKLPLIAILRGILPSQVEPICEVLVAAGFEQIEIPLNSPEPFDSIMQLAACAPSHVLIGAGTVTQIKEVEQVKQAGGQLVVTPHTDSEIIRTTKALNMISVPGFNTPSEALHAIAAGADILKWFPAGQQNPEILTAIKTVLPKNIPVYAVGGITLDNMEQYYKAGADGFGLGSVLFKPGKSVAEVSQLATQFVTRWKQLSHK